MALLKCCDCGHEVSEHAEKCPNCGCPIKIIRNDSIKEGETIIKGKKYNVRILQQFYKQSRDDAKALKILREISGLDFNDAILYHNTIRENNRIIPQNLDEAVEEYKAANRARVTAMADHALKCPYCKSTNVKKISLTGKALSIGTLGLFSKKIGKQWHCNKCNSDF